MGLKLNLAEHLQLYHTTHYKKNLFLFFIYDLLGSYVSNVIHFCHYHRLQILQQEDHEVEIHRV